LQAIKLAIKPGQACRIGSHYRFSRAHFAQYGESICGGYIMKKEFVVVIIMLAVIFLLASPTMAERVTLVGEVNDNHQIVADNEIYDVDDNAMGDDLVLNYIAQKVKVVGQLRESEESKIITVESFEVVGE
jgi:hypothetical protein